MKIVTSYPDIPPVNFKRDQQRNETDRSILH